MKFTYLIVLLIVLSGCAIQKNENIQRKYEIEDSLVLSVGNDSIKIYELKFIPKYRSTDLQQFLFKNHGKWDEIIKIERETSILVWRNLKLIDSSNELFTVMAGGEDKEFETIKINGKQNFVRIFYCSVSVFNSKNSDCLAPTSEIKNDLVDYFINGVNTIDKNEIIELESLVNK